jgi:hypothetical protein
MPAIRMLLIEVPTNIRWLPVPGGAKLAAALMVLAP